MHDKASGSDKKNGVVGLVCFDLRRRGSVGRLALVGTTGRKNAAIREHLKSVAGQYRDLDPTVDQFPADNVDSDPHAYRAAVDAMKPGDAVTIFTPDELHFEQAMYAVRKGLHVLVAKPAVMKASEHAQLIKEAAERNVLVMVENHKRWDPIYSDARGRIRTFGDMGFFSAFMSQPKTQLETFSKWLGKGSDISYYLNSHHVDFLCWAMQGLAIPISVVAMGSTGVAKVTEDTITLMVQFKNLASGNLGTALFTSSWVAAKKAEVHSQQRFSYMGHTGEMRVDQAHRGYELATDDGGYASVNPLYSELKVNVKRLKNLILTSFSLVLQCVILPTQAAILQPNIRMDTAVSRALLRHALPLIRARMPRRTLMSCCPASDRLMLSLRFLRQAEKAWTRAVCLYPFRSICNVGMISIDCFSCDTSPI